MLKRHAQLFIAFLAAADLVLAALLWLGLYTILFDTALLDPLIVWATGTKKPPHPRDLHFLALPFAVLAVHVGLRTCGVYRPRREGKLLGEALAISKGAALATLLVLAFQNFFQHGASFSRAFHLLFFGSLSIATTGAHLAARLALRGLRERGWNLRHVLICGGGASAETLARALNAHPWTGLRVAGFLDDEPARWGTILAGAPVLGPLSELHERIARGAIDQVICALPFEESSKLPKLLEALTSEVVDVRLVPDVLGFAHLNMSVSEIEGLPLINLREGPLVGWNSLVKRAVDLVVSVAVLILAAVPMLLVAVLIKLTSRGPVLYAQERMGLDGRTFPMLKFRTMRIDAEAESGPVWASPEDPRRTPLGKFLRATSLDELPQFFNVLAGHMSVVGPRPERPVFISEFRKRIPHYMLRHKIKAGITGWAQVNGWRGNTSIEKRIQYDLYYIEHWSVWFDLWIILLTPFKGLAGKNAY